MCCNYWALVPQPEPVFCKNRGHALWNLRAATTEPTRPGACVPWLEKRKFARHNWREARVPQWKILPASTRSPRAATNTRHSRKINNNFLKILKKPPNFELAESPKRPLLLHHHLGKGVVMDGMLEHKLHHLESKSAPGNSAQISNPTMCPEGGEQDVLWTMLLLTQPFRRVLMVFTPTTGNRGFMNFF